MAKIRVTMATLLMAGVVAVGAAALCAAGPGNRKTVRVLQVAGPAAKSTAFDSLGDPLPRARLRLETLRFRPPSIVVELALSPDERNVVSVGEELIVWDAVTGKERWRVHGREFGAHLPAAVYGLRALAFSADSSRFYTPGPRHLRNELVVWETASGRRDVLTIATPNRIGEREGATRSIDITPDSGRPFEHQMFYIKAGRELNSPLWWRSNLDGSPT